MITRLRTVWLPAIVLAALVPAFIGLGLWQLQRADEKRVRQQEYDRRTEQAPVKLGAAPEQADALRFRRVMVRGRYDTDYQILIDNRVHHGVAGYHVITPLIIEGSEMRVLVNRGWVPLGATRERLPPIDTPHGIQQVSGVATVPAEKIFTLGDPPVTRGWQPVWSHLDMGRYSASVPFSVQPIVVLLDADTPAGFARDWGRLDAGIAIHQGYAFQWFALAALAVFIIIVMGYRAARHRRHN